MQPRRQPIGILLTAAILLVGSCLGIQIPFLPFGNAVSPTPAVLSRCEPNPSTLCLLSFGIQPPYEMLITFFVPPESPSDFYVRVTYGEMRALYKCVTVKDIPTSHYCTGAQIPLGTSIGIEILATQGNALLAEGDFVLNGLAFPTPAGGSPSSSTSAAPTALSTLPAQTPTATLSVPPTASPAYP
jgi:hypothetical protein